MNCSILIMKNSLKTNLISQLKLINIFIIIFVVFNLIDIELKAHLKGY